MTDNDARPRVAEYLRQFDRLRDTGGVIHEVHTDPDAEMASLTADDLRALLAAADAATPARTLPDEGAITRLLGVEGHKVDAYGQGSYDGDFCRQCGWQGPPRSGADHTAETRRVAFTEALAAVLADQPTTPSETDDALLGGEGGAA